MNQEAIVNSEKYLSMIDEVMDRMEWSAIYKICKDNGFIYEEDKPITITDLRDTARYLLERTFFNYENFSGDKAKFDYEIETGRFKAEGWVDDIGNLVILLRFIPFGIEFSRKVK